MKSRAAFVLSIMFVVLAAIASAGGLFLNGLYRDNAFVTAAWQANDLITLLVMVPVLSVALVLAQKGSQRNSVRLFNNMTPRNGFHHKAG